MRSIDADELEERFSIECVGECTICPHCLREVKVINEPNYNLSETIVETVSNYFCDLIRNAPTISIDSRIQNTSSNETLTMKGEDKDDERE